MKIYVALGGWAYEGWAAPLGVYSSPALARDALAKGYKSYGERKILEYDLDALGEWPNELKPVEVPLKD